MTNRIDLDLGNGFLKFMRNGQPVTLPAVVAPVYDLAKFSQCPVFGCTSSTSGSVQNGSKWITGNDANDFAPLDTVRVGSIPKSEGKGRYALQQLAAIVEPVNQTIAVNCSVPNIRVQGRQVENALRGTHHLTRNGQPFVLEVPLVSLRPEGFGSVYAAIATGLAPADKINVGLDIGSQTAILTAFNPRGVEIDSMRVVVDTGGAQSLYGRIATHSAIVSAFGGELSPDDIESAIRATPHSPTVDGYGFEAIYREVKALWLQNIIDRAKASVNEVWPKIGSIVCFGGGVELVRSELERLPKAVVLANAQTANVTGLAALPLASQAVAA